MSKNRSSKEDQYIIAEQKNEKIHYDNTWKRCMETHWKRCMEFLD